MKQCYRCKETKPESNFRYHKTTKDKLNSWCVQCLSTYSAARYQDKLAITNRNKDVPCMDCGHRYPPYVMDFDHRQGELKLFTIGNGPRVHGLQAEIDKCDVVCANCHRIRTHQRRTEARDN